MQLSKVVLFVFLLYLLFVSYAADGDTNFIEAVKECQKLIDPEQPLIGTNLRSGLSGNEVEQCLLQALPNILSKEGIYHHIVLNDGSIKTWINANTAVEECPCSPFYTFVNYIPEHDYVVIAHQYDEGYGYELVSLQSGESYFFHTFPQLSPDRQRFFVFETEWPFTVFKSEVWNFNSGYPEREFEYLHSNNRRAFAKWLSDNNVIIQEYHYIRNEQTNADDKVIGFSILFQFNNSEWQVKEM